MYQLPNTLISIARIGLACLPLIGLARGGTTVPISNGYFDSTGTPPTDWQDVDGSPSLRTFNAGGQRMISTTGSAPFTAEQITSQAVSPNTTYLLEFEHGFAASSDLTDGYQVSLGTSDGTSFTALGSKSGILTSTSRSADFQLGNAIYNSLQVTTGTAVSGNDLAVQLGIDSTNVFQGYDNVHLTAFAANEIVIGNHSFDMSTRGNQGTAVGGVDNLAAWTEITTATARGFQSGAYRSLIGQGVADAFTVEQVLGTAISANTAYTLTIDIGFMQSGAGITGDYLIQLGTSDGGVFTMLAELDSSLVQSSTGQYFLGSGNSTEAVVLLETGEIVSGDNLAIRLSKQDTTTFFGFDQVALTFEPIPEPTVASLFGALSILCLLRRRR